MDSDRQEFLKEQLEVYRSADLERFKAYCRKHQMQIHLAQTDTVLLMSLHKGRLTLPGITEAEKQESRLWLIEHGFSEDPATPDFN